MGSGIHLSFENTSIGNRRGEQHVGSPHFLSEINISLYDNNDQEVVSLQDVLFIGLWH